MILTAHWSFDLPFYFLWTNEPTISCSVTRGNRSIPEISSLMFSSYLFLFRAITVACSETAFGYTSHLFHHQVIHELVRAISPQHNNVSLRCIAKLYGIINLARRISSDLFFISVLFTHLFPLKKKETSELKERRACQKSSQRFSRRLTGNRQQQLLAASFPGRRQRWRKGSRQDQSIQLFKCTRRFKSVVDDELFIAAAIARTPVQHRTVPTTYYLALLNWMRE